MDANILQTFAMLILAVAVIAGIMIVIKKITIRKNENKAVVDLNVISKITLQPKNHLFVVKAAGKLLLLGVTDSSVNILTELDADSVKNINTKSRQELTNELLNKANKSNLETNKILKNDLSFMNFIKDTLKFGNN